MNPQDNNPVTGQTDGQTQYSLNEGYNMGQQGDVTQPFQPTDVNAVYGQGGNMPQPGEMNQSYNMSQPGDMNQGYNMSQPGDMNQGYNMSQPGDMNQGYNMGQPGDMNQGYNMGQPGGMPQPGDMNQGYNMGQPGDMNQGYNMGQPGDMNQGYNMGQPGDMNQGYNMGQPGGMPQPGDMNQGYNMGQPGDMNQGYNMSQPGGMPQPGDMNQGYNMGQPGSMPQPGDMNQGYNMGQPGGMPQPGNYVGQQYGYPVGGAAYQQQQSANKKKLGVIIGVIAAIVVVIVGIVVAVVLGGGDKDKDNDPGTNVGQVDRPTATPTPKPTEEVKPTQTDTPAPDPTETPTPTPMGGTGTVDAQIDNIASIVKPDNDYRASKIGYYHNGRILLNNDKWEDSSWLHGELVAVDTRAPEDAFIFNNKHICRFIEIDGVAYYTTRDVDTRQYAFWKQDIGKDTQPELLLNGAEVFTFSYYNGMIYYDNWSDWYRLYCYNPASGSNERIDSDRMGYYTILEDSVYYENLDDGFVYRMGLNGLGKTKLFDLADFVSGYSFDNSRILESMTAFRAQGNLYFAFQTPDGEMYIVNEDGSESKLVASDLEAYDMEQDIYYANGSVYYSTDNGCAIHKLDIDDALNYGALADIPDSFDDGIICEDSFDYFEVVDGVLYVELWDDSNEDIRIYDSQYGYLYGKITIASERSSGSRTETGEYATVRGNGIGVVYADGYVLLTTENGVGLVYRDGDKYRFADWVMSVYDDVEIKSIALYGDYAYLACGDGGIMRTDIENGGTILQIIGGYITSFTIAENKIFYIVMEDKYDSWGALYMADLDGRNAVKLEDEIICVFLRSGSADFEYVGGYLYYVGENSELKRMKPDGTGMETLVTRADMDYSSVRGIYYHDGKLYMVGDDSIYAYDIAAGTVRKVVDENVENYYPLVFLGDTMFYVDETWRWHQVRDGRDEEYPSSLNNGSLYMELLDGELFCLANYSEYYSVDYRNGQIISENPVDIDYFGKPNF